MSMADMELVESLCQRLAELTKNPGQERTWSRPSFPKQEHLAMAIHRGDIDEARSYVKDFCSKVRQKLTEDSQLMLTAVQLNKPEFIRFLVEECHADLEKPVKKVVISSDAKDSDPFITPLRYAVKRKRTEAAMELMRLGANVNAASPETGQTALLYACKRGTLSIVRELIQYGADLMPTDEFGITALMYAVDHVDVCHVLIESGACVNDTCNYGNTALHQAAQRKNTNTMKLLIKNGADIFQKNFCMEDAFSIACLGLPADIVKAIIDEVSDDNVRHKALIRSHQLLGARYITYHDPTDASSCVGDALIEWETAIRLRDERRRIITEEDDIVSVPNSAYDNAVEVDSMPELDKMRQDVNKIYMQGLLLTEKIVGPAVDVTISSVLSLAEFYMRSEDYGRVLRLMRHGFKLTCGCRSNSPIINHCYLINLWRIGRLYHWFPFIRHASTNAVDFKIVYEFLETVLLEVKCLGPPARGEKGVPSHDKENMCFIRIIFFLIKFFYLLKNNKDQIFQFKKLVYNFIQLNLRFEGRTFLMNAIYPIEENYHKCFSLDVDVIKLLLECGADAGETDYNGNSTLHLLAKSEQWRLNVTGNIPNNKLAKKVVDMLLASGAHFDIRNDEGSSAVDYLSFLEFDLPSHITLQCLAAQTIRHHKIPYEGILPKSLIDFVQMH